MKILEGYCQTIWFTGNKEYKFFLFECKLQLDLRTGLPTFTGSSSGNIRVYTKTPKDCVDLSNIFYRHGFSVSGQSFSYSSNDLLNLSFPNDPWPKSDETMVYYPYDNYREFFHNTFDFLYNSNTDRELMGKMLEKLKKDGWKTGYHLLQTNGWEDFGLDELVIIK